MFGVRTFGSQTFGVMTFGIQMFRVITFGIQMFGVTTFGSQTFGVMTFGIQMFGVMTFGSQMFGVMTFGIQMYVERFFSGYSSFPSPRKPTFPSSNSPSNQVDEELLCGRATSRSLFSFLFKYLE